MSAHGPIYFTCFPLEKDLIVIHGPHETRSQENQIHDRQVAPIKEVFLNQETAHSYVGIGA
ncbi:MAG: hypothetical protein QGG90_09315, partial [Nitrospinota bacterium]|nr:hypothetical protein [Nitrospinota bacterium]